MQLLKTRKWARAAAFGGILAFASAPAGATDDPEGVTRGAAKHFQRAVELYAEADYRAALVEFKRAYALVPNAAVLYDIAQTEYELQAYAEALTTFQRFLGESSPAEPHRREVEASVEVLRKRVGTLEITTAPAGADVEIDDQPLGKTPLPSPVLVSIGRRKVTATLSGRPPAVRFVEVAAGDEAPVFLQVGLPGEIYPTAPWPWESPGDPPTSARDGASLRALGWLGTGLLAAGAVTFGVLSLRESQMLQDDRESFPASSGELAHQANLTFTYSVLADSLAAAAVVVGGVTLFATLSSGSSKSPAGGTGVTRVGVGPGSARLEMTF